MSVLGCQDVQAGLELVLTIVQKTSPLYYSNAQR